MIMFGLMAIAFFMHNEQKKEWKRRHPGATDEDYYEAYNQNMRWKPEF
jgi:hypothetical protein